MLAGASVGAAFPRTSDESPVQQLVRRPARYISAAWPPVRAGPRRRPSDDLPLPTVGQVSTGEVQVGSVSGTD